METQETHRVKGWLSRKTEQLIELMISAQETDTNKCNCSGWLPEIQCMCIVYLYTVYPHKPSAFI